MTGLVIASDLTTEPGTRFSSTHVWNDLDEEWAITVGKARRFRPVIDQLDLPHTAFVAWGSVGIAHIVPDSHFFQFHDDGELAIIIAAHDGFVSKWQDPLPDAPIGDLVAFYPDNPHRFYVRRGDMWALGSGLLDDLLMRPEIWLFETPLDWLRAGRDGLCVLDWRRGIAPIVSLGRRLNVQNAAFGQTVERRSRAYLDSLMPEIFVDASFGFGAARSGE